MTRARWLILVALTSEPALAQGAAPPSMSQTTQESVTVNQLLAVMAERDRQYAQRFDAQEKALQVALTTLNQRFDTQEKSTIVALAAAKEAVQAALIAAKEAVQKAEFASEKRFDSVNEFRNSLKDQQTTLMSRTEADTRFKDLERRAGELTAQIAQKVSESRGASDLWGFIVGAVGILAAVGMLFMNYGAKRVRA